MEKIKLFIEQHFEKILVSVILVAILAINHFVSYKIGFLNFFYFPVIISGYYLGRRMAVLTATFSVLTVILLVILNPDAYFLYGEEKLPIIVGITAWASFLILTSYAMGYLYEEKENRIKDLKTAYIGVLELMSKYLETAGRYTQGHSVRVARISQDIAIAMHLAREEVENVKAAALLHDIGKTEISMELVNKAASLSSKERDLMDKHSEKGAKILTLVGAVLKDAVPIVLAHHKYYFESDKPFSEKMDALPQGAAIIAVADAYDAMITDRPYRAGKPPWKAVEEIEKEAGKQFHPEVVKAFKHVIQTEEKYRLEQT